MLRPEERKKAKQFDIELLAALRDVSSSLQSLLDEKIRTEADAEISSRVTNAIQNSETLRSVTDRLNTLVAQGETEHQKQERRFQNRYLFVQWLLFIATAAAFVAAAVYAHIASQQKDTMDKQLDTMSDAFHESQMQSDAIELSTEATRDAAKTAAAALNETKRAFVIDQRPYLIAEGLKFVDLPATLNPSVNVSFKDVGKTPAKEHRNFSRLRTYRFINSADKERNGIHFLSFIQSNFDEMEAAARKPTSPGTLNPKQDIAPNQASPFITRTLPTPLTADELHSITADAGLILIMFGFTQYEDSFGTHYQSNYCSYFLAQIQTLGTSVQRITQYAEMVTRVTIYFANQAVIDSGDGTGPEVRHVRAQDADAGRGSRARRELRLADRLG